MTDKNRTYSSASLLTTVAMVLALVSALATAHPAQAQTYNVIHNFTGGVDVAQPEAGLTIDRAGNLYGTTYSGGQGCSGIGCGTVFKMLRKSPNWFFDPLYRFSGAADGANPTARLLIGADGSLYGSTSAGGDTNCLFGQGCGTVFNLKPPPRAPTSVLAPWEKKLLYAFTDPGGGAPQGDLIFDQNGNIYGTATGEAGPGTVYELLPSGSGWTLNLLHKFSGGNDGALPYGGVIFDSSGNLYGTTSLFGLHNGGTIFQLVPSGGTWAENVLFSFDISTSGAAPQGGLIFDKSGNLYGTTTNGGTGGGGKIFELSSSLGYSLLYSFSGGNGCGPKGTLIMDSAGNLYGTTYCDGANNSGSVFMLTPTPSPPWTLTSLHDFTGGSDGGHPYSNVVFDANGNLYGTASSGGSQGYGAVWEITPGN